MAGLEAFSAGPGAPIEQLLVTDTSLVALSRGSISTFDTETGSPLSERFAFASSDAVALPSVERVVVDTRLVADRAQSARRLARALAGTGRTRPRRGASAGTEEQRIRDLLDVEGHVVVDAYLTDEQRERVGEAIDAGDLPGVELERAPLLAVAGHDGVAIVDAWTLDPITEIATDEPVSALVLVEKGLSEPTLYAASGDGLEIVAFTTSGPGLPTRLAMPGDHRGPRLERARQPRARPGRGARGRSHGVRRGAPRQRRLHRCAAARWRPDASLADTQPERPQDDRGELLAIGADGRLASVGIDGNAFGWRLPGVLMGALMAGAPVPAGAPPLRGDAASPSSPPSSSSPRACSSPTPASA